MSKKSKKANKRSRSPKISPKAARAAERAMEAHRRGDLDGAERDYCSALRHTPSHPELSFNLGLIYAQSGRSQQAVPLLETAAAANPDDPAASVALANIQRELGRPAQARAAYESVLAIDPTHLNARYNLATLAHEQGDLPSAQAHYKLMLQAVPNDDGVWNALGSSWLETGDLRQANECLSRAHELAPEHIDILANLGFLRLRQGDLKAAEELFQNVRAKQAGHARAVEGLIRILCRTSRGEEAVAMVAALPTGGPSVGQVQKQLAEQLHEYSDYARATSALEAAIDGDPNWLGGRIKHAMALKWDGREKDARKSLQATLQQFNGNMEAISDVGAAFRVLGDTHRALELFERARELAPNDALNLNNIGLCLVDKGDISAAQDCFDQALKLEPLQPHAWYNRSRTRRYRTEDDTFVQFVREFYPATSGSLDDDPLGRSLIEFALGKVHDDLGEYDKAFAHFERANRLQHAASRYSAEQNAERTDKLIAAFDSTLFERPSDGAVRNQTPVLIVGMPRSGTTLVEQILASHPAVFGAGELLDLPGITKAAGRLSNQPYPAALASLGPADHTKLARTYLARLRELGGDALRVTDKLPTNFQHLGLAAYLMPDVRIIHCRRDPMDTCFANYIQYFTEGHGYSYNLNDTAHFYGLYRRLMDHWNAVLPTTTIVHVDYEAVIEDVETQARRLIAHVGLEWDDQCLRFYESRRNVETASNWQVRQPIYKEASNRWRRYATHLEGLRSALMIQLPHLEIN
jgi:tetratricopeptide (TPR) repeat protein